jgi:hypothetical protein
MASSEEKVMIDMGSANNKGMIITRVPNSSMHAVKWAGGGELPAALKGQKWTSQDKARLAIDVWQASQKSKTVKK